MDDIDIFFELGAPGIIEATHIDAQGDEHPLIGEFINPKATHRRGAGHINQDEPHFKMPAIHAQAVELDDVIVIDEARLVVSEKLTPNTGLALIYLAVEHQSGSHRWG